MVETWSTRTAGGSCVCRERFGCGLDDQALVDQGHASDGRYAVAYIDALVAQLPERRGEHHHEIRDSVFSACESKSREWITCRSEEHTSELQSLMRISYAVFCLKKKIQTKITEYTNNTKDNNT